MLMLVTYDVNTETPAGRRRLRRVARACLDYGRRVQHSVFECEVDPAQWTMLRPRLLEEIDPERDSLRFYRLGAEGTTAGRTCRRQAASGPGGSAGVLACAIRQGTCAFREDRGGKIRRGFRTLSLGRLAWTRAGRSDRRGSRDQRAFVLQTNELSGGGRPQRGGVDRNQCQSE